MGADEYDVIRFLSLSLTVVSYIFCYNRVKVVLYMHVNGTARNGLLEDIVPCFSIEVIKRRYARFPSEARFT